MKGLLVRWKSLRVELRSQVINVCVISPMTKPLLSGGGIHKKNVFSY